MRILSLVHEETPSSGLLAEVALERGDELDEWSLAWGTPMPRPIEEYSAVVVLGGAMHVDQEDQHPWLRDETCLVGNLLERRVPLLGVCLGAQLLAAAANGRVAAASEPEIGWHVVELGPDGAADPVLGVYPDRFEALQWHHYAFELPVGGVPLATSPRCLQAFRLGDLAWGIQFHAEATRDELLSWIDSEQANPTAESAGFFDATRLRADTEQLIERWNEHGRALAAAFLQTAAGAAGQEHQVGRSRLPR